MEATVITPSFEDMAKNLLKMWSEPEIAERMSQLGFIITPLVQEFTPVATGHLKASTHHRVVIRESGVVDVEIVQTSKNIKGGYPGHFISYGTRPHVPPLQAIVDWYRNKTGASLRDAIPVARRIIYRGIALVGVQPNDYRRIALGAALPFIEEAVEDTGMRMIARAFTVGSSQETVGQY